MAVWTQCQFHCSDLLEEDVQSDVACDQLCDNAHSTAGEVSEEFGERAAWKAGVGVSDPRCSW